MNLVILVLSWSKLLPNLEDDLQGFPNEEVDNSEIIDMVCAVRNFVNINEDNIKEWLHSNAWELGFQHMTGTDIANAAMKQKREEEDVEDDCEEEGQSSKCISHSMSLQRVDTDRLHGSDGV
jgi:hypothetical protein